MSDCEYTDEYEKYNYEFDKYIFCKNGGKQRSKLEVSQHTNQFDPCGHSRKIMTKLINTELNKKNNIKTKS
ncbi:GSCOCG00009468001-RA-CDS [Cotesia congregata]|uniref:Uncharacterized protein n=1 Tax=Cotesia congregata TaxID=51543 RepID=A0A8J2H9J4_COTCN|nr:GSCOCG00009468001-RA-CDS [Cotesia congregata]CAG5088891.1 Protein of unknown function [Cotesia congregata]